MNQNNSVQIGVRVPPHTASILDKRVEEGYAMNRADAVRRIIDKELGISEE